MPAIFFFLDSRQKFLEIQAKMVKRYPFSDQTGSAKLCVAGLNGEGVGE